jgi:hypothetical protein
MSSSDVVCVPVKLDAYSLNQSACGTYPDSTLAPLAQPNFTWLRLDSNLMEPDVLPYHDLHNASPWYKNPRITDLGSGQPRFERMGVYLHWMIPRIYRSGSVHPTAEGQAGVQKPQFHLSPDRWLVVRRLHPGTFKPDNVISLGKMKSVDAWVVESNRVRNIVEFGDDIDIELECAPYVVGDDSTPLEQQAEIFIGAKSNLVKDQNNPDGWQEKRKDASDAGFVPLNVIGASNPLFADYTAHNPNVFSILDNFSYQDGDNIAYLTEATASYCVLGWHSLSSEDNLANLGSDNLADVFRQCFLQLMSNDGFDIGNAPPVRALCQGAMYSVQYVRDGTDGITVPAHDAANKLADATSHPITVGTTSVDAVIAYVRAHTGTDSATETDILHLDTLLLKQDDDIDSQQEAMDMLTAHNFQFAKDSGSHWHFIAAKGSDASGGAATSTRSQKVFEPTETQNQQLVALNAAQSALDTATRELTLAQQELFAHWWKFCSDSTWLDRLLKEINPTNPPPPASIAQELAQTVSTLQTRVNVLSALVATAQAPLTVPKTTTSNSNVSPVASGSDLPLVEMVSLVEKGSQDSFYLQNDPTILVPGVPNPWPTDWLDSGGLKVRMISQLQIADLPATLPDNWTELPNLIVTQIPKRLPGGIEGAAAALMKEFFHLRPSDGPNDPPDPDPTNLLPLYHDGRDQWNNTQPYFPLFLEYEIQYYHLDFSLWVFGKPDIDNPDVSLPQVRYGLDEDTDIKPYINDQRTINGRILVLPQPGFTISKNIERLFRATNASDLPADLQTDAEQKALVTDAAQLQYLSAPLTGMKDHLITLLNGIHIKPSIRMPNQPLQPLQAAIVAAKDSGIGDPEIKLMGIETTKTPYANYVEFPDADINPLKPVTHGQFKFTRLDIIDKFGQAISAINPAPATSIPPVYPALSEYFHPQHLKGNRDMAKTVESDSYVNCEFGQFPPTINQEARINASFLHFDVDQKVYRPCTEWETPIWGFLVVNYAEYAMQVFLPDGTFYREVRRGGPDGTTASPKWKPFAPPDDTNGEQAALFPQLDALITKLKNDNYLTAVFDMVDEALKSVPHTPNDYAEFLNAVVGRPLALANVGFSLELAAPPVKSQETTSSYVQPELYSPPDKAELLGYKFPVKIGDKDRVYDGLVGYFEANDGALTGGVAPGNELKLGNILTYYPSAGSTFMTPISDKHRNYPNLYPYHLSTLPLDDLQPSTSSDKQQAAAMALAKESWASMTMIGVLMDPFSDIHFYSGILPVASLGLPSWSLQSAMQRMTAFFHVGPLLVTNTGLKYDPKAELSQTYDLATASEVEAVPDPNAPAGSDASKPKPIGVPLPSIKSADWNWLAPFVPSLDSVVSGSDAPSKDTVWNPFVIDQVDNKPKYEKGPYMAIEGYLQLKHPITAPSTL